MENGKLIGLLDAIQLSFKQLFKKDNFVFYLKAELLRIGLAFLMLIPVAILFATTIGPEILKMVEQYGKFMGNTYMMDPGELNFQNSEFLKENYMMDPASPEEATEQYKELLKKYGIQDMEGVSEKDFMIPGDVKSMYVEDQGEQVGDIEIPVPYGNSNFDIEQMEEMGFLPDMNTLFPKLIIFILVLIPFAFLMGAFFNVYSTKAGISIVTGNLPSMGELTGFSFRLSPKMVIVNLISSIIILIGFLLLVIPGFIALVLLMFANWILVYEGKGAFESIKTSYNRNKSYFFNLLGKGFGYMVLVWFITWAVTAVASIFKAEEFEILVSFVMQLLISAITPLVLTNIYLDLKNKFEPGTMADVGVGPNTKPIMEADPKPVLEPSTDNETVNTDLENNQQL